MIRQIGREASRVGVHDRRRCCPLNGCAGAVPRNLREYRVQASGGMSAKGRKGASKPGAKRLICTTSPSFASPRCYDGTHRGDVNDRAALVAAHQRNRRLGTEDVAHQVDVEDLAREVVEHG